MPLIKGRSKKAFEQNVKAEMHAGKPQDQALAIAYSVKRKAQKKASGGTVESGSPTMNMAEGGAISASNEKRPSTQETNNDRHEVARNAAQHALKPTANALNESNRTQAQRGPKTTKLKHPKMVPSSVINARLSDMEDDQMSSMPPSSPKEQPAQWMDEEGPNRKGPNPPPERKNHQLTMMAEGGTAGNPTSRIDTGFGKIIVQEHDEPSSIAEAILRKRKMMANGGVADHADPMHEDDMSLKEGQVDIDDNARELPNAYYGRNEDKVLKENFDEDIIHMSQPMDSNEIGDEREDATSDKHDMVSIIRRKMKK